MHITYLPDAVAAGARVVSGAKVERVLFESRRATGLEVQVGGNTGARRRVRVKAGTVVVSAGTVHTPILLGASGLRHPQLGKRMTIHPGVKISGLFPGADFFEGPGVPQRPHRPRPNRAQIVHKRPPNVPTSVWNQLAARVQIERRVAKSLILGHSWVFEIWP